MTDKNKIIENELNELKLFFHDQFSFLVSEYKMIETHSICNRKAIHFDKLNESDRRLDYTLEIIYENPILNRKIVFRYNDGHNPYNLISITSDNKMVDSTNGVVMCYLNGSEADYKYKDYAYKVVKKENKIGVVAPDGRQIVPTSFDKLEFRYIENDILLYKNGRKGVKLLNSPFSLIDAKYDSIKLSKTFRISSSKTFYIFEVTLNNKIFFVGENGVEYFHLH